MNEESRFTAAQLAGKKLLLAKAEFSRAYMDEIQKTPACDDATGYRILRLFRAEVIKFVVSYQRGSDPGVRQAADEMYRKIAVGRAEYTMQEMRGFVEWYDVLTDKIASAISDLFELHGDGFSDLCDSLPLAEEFVLAKCLAGKFRAESALLEALRAQSDTRWADFFQGENYVESRLRLVTCKRFLTHLTDTPELFSEEDLKSMETWDILGIDD